MKHKINDLLKNHHLSTYSKIQKFCKIQVKRTKRRRKEGKKLTMVIIQGMT